MTLLKTFLFFVYMLQNINYTSSHTAVDLCYHSNPIILRMMCRSLLICDFSIELFTGYNLISTFDLNLRGKTGK